MHNQNGSFEDIRTALLKGRYDVALHLHDVSEELNHFMVDSIAVLDGKVMLDGVEYESDVSNAIVQAIDNGTSPTALINFLQKIIKHPSLDARTRLFAFIDNINLPLAEDGDIYAYKVVNNNLMDKYTGTLSNHIGATVSMARELVTEDPHITCSSGLHFCAESYIAAYSNLQDCVVKVKVNPLNVVSIPIDYGNAKGRCCEYEVVGLLRGTPNRLDISFPWEGA